MMQGERDRETNYLLRVSNLRKPCTEKRRRRETKKNRVNVSCGEIRLSGIECLIERDQHLNITRASVSIGLRNSLFDGYTWMCSVST